MIYICLIWIKNVNSNKPITLLITSYGGDVYAQSTDLQAEAGNIKSLEYVLQDMMDALQLPIVDELQNKLSENKNDDVPLILWGEPESGEQMELFND